MRAMASGAYEKQRLKSLVRLVDSVCQRIQIEKIEGLGKDEESFVRFFNKSELEAG